MDGDAAELALADAWREHWARLLARVAQEHGDLDLAEESVAEAFADAAASWGNQVPAEPAAWLLTVARRRAVDALRRRATLRRKLPLLVRDLDADEEAGEVPLGRGGGEQVTDERLRLVCTCCHPALSHEASVALTLRLVGGLTTREVARLFVVSEATMAARLTRAKRKIALAGIPYRVPGTTDLPARLSRVCAVTYLLFTEGYSATEGQHLLRPELCAEAIRLQSLLVELVPDDSEVYGLLALMTLQHARRDARVDGGRLVPLAEQDRSRWRSDEVERGRAQLAASASLAHLPGRYATQAAIAAEHLAAREPADTDWTAIATLYGHLERLTGSPVVRLNRAVAVGEAHGPTAGLDLLTELDERLPRHHLLPATRAELLRRLGRTEEAVAAYTAAIERVRTDLEREHLHRRRDEVRDLV